MNRPLYEWSSEELLSHLRNAQERTIAAELSHHRAKARFEAAKALLVQNYIETHKCTKAVAEGMVQGTDQFSAEHEAYLSALSEYELAKASQMRAREALSLWQTERADNRKI